MRKPWKHSRECTTNPSPMGGKLKSCDLGSQVYRLGPVKVLIRDICQRIQESLSNLNKIHLVLHDWHH